MKRTREAGFTLIAAAVSTVALLAATGLAVDLGRMYIAKNELQSYADSAALLAAQQLDGSTAGLNAARNAAINAPVFWHLGTRRVTSPVVEFSPAPVAGVSGYNWQATPVSATGLSLVRVQANVPVPLYFLKVVAPSTGAVAASAIAGQVPKTSWRQGVFPFSPFAHTFRVGAPGTTPCGNPISVGCQDQLTGLIIGQEYTLRWPSNPALGNAAGNGSNMCAGDRTAGQQIVDIANQAGGSERGYIEDTSSSLIRQTIIDDLQSVTRTVGDLVTMTGGAKQTQLSSLFERINQDTNTGDNDPEAYYRSGNHRRVVACLINDGLLVGGNQYTAIQMGAFLLKQTGQYGTGGNQSWCGIYLGPFCQGCAGKPSTGTGGYVVRLVE